MNSQKSNGKTAALRPSKIGRIMTKRYKITITETGQETRIIGNDWKEGAHENGQSFGYTPEIEATLDYERQLYQQHVDELDLKAVINAVNP